VLARSMNPWLLVAKSRHSERGASTVLVLAIAIVLLGVGGCALALLELVIHQTQLGQLADEAARAGAHAAVEGGVACDAVTRFVSVGPATVQRCDASETVIVTLTAPLPPLLQRWLPTSRLHATARAG